MGVLVQVGQYLRAILPAGGFPGPAGVRVSAGPYLRAELREVGFRGLAVWGVYCEGGAAVGRGFGPARADSSCRPCCRGARVSWVAGVCVCV